MARYMLKRLLMLIPILLGVTLLIFILQEVSPGDPALLNNNVDATEEELDQWREKYGLNDSFFVQYFKYIWNIISKGDLGISYRTGKSVTSELLSRWPTTFLLSILTEIVGMAVGIGLGIYASLHRDTLGDSVARIFAMLGVSMPQFWFALLLIIEFALNLKWFPVSGFYGPEYWVLPAVSGGLLGAASYMRNTRSAMLDQISQDFVRTARAKGQKEGKVVSHHILKNAMIPIITSIGLHFSASLAGTMIVEQIFSIAGLGTYMVQAVNNRDWPQVRAAVLLTACTVSVINLLMDFAYASVDPRIKAGFAGKAAKKKKIVVEEEQTGGVA